MKQLTVISGKGGTGKTTLTAAFACLADRAVIADCDVDAADLHLILEPQIEREEQFVGGQIAYIDKNLCTRCGMCEQVCRFGAIKHCTMDPVSCEGCKVCTVVCPENAITMRDNIAGYWYISTTREGPMVHARLGIAEDNSGKLVSVVRQNAKLIAEKEKRDLIIIDGPPGIGCPVIASITGADLVFVVTEPTLSGHHDMERVLNVADHFSIPAVVCVNKFDINEENTQIIVRTCRERGIEVSGKIPYDNYVTEAMIHKKSVVEYQGSSIAEEVVSIWNRVYSRLR